VFFARGAHVLPCTPLLFFCGFQQNLVWNEFSLQPVVVALEIWRVLGCPLMSNRKPYEDEMWCFFVSHGSCDACFFQSRERIKQSITEPGPKRRHSIPVKMRLSFLREMRGSCYLSWLRKTLFVVLT
jgi:hypothetical protein